MVLLLTESYFWPIMTAQQCEIAVIWLGIIFQRALERVSVPEGMQDEKAATRLSFGSSGHTGDVASMANMRLRSPRKAWKQWHTFLSPERG